MVIMFYIAFFLKNLSATKTYALLTSFSAFNIIDGAEFLVIFLRYIFIQRKLVNLFY